MVSNVFVGKGLYTAFEASQLTRVPIWSIRRWSQGYRYKYRGGSCFSKPAIATDIDRIDNQIALSFADLMELRVLQEFLNAGVSWKTIRISSQRARDILKVSHPFSMRKFRTDGHTILMEIAHETCDKVLLNLLTKQYEMQRLLTPYLKNEMDFANDKPERWWPLGKKKNVVIDPTRLFGTPIVDIEGIPTKILMRAYQSEKSFLSVSHWFEVSKASIKDAIEFENRLAA